MSMTEKIQEAAEKHSKEMWPDPVLVRQREYAEHSFRHGVKWLKKMQNWVSVNHSMPESYIDLIQDSEDLTHTVKLLVVTETGSIYDNTRVKMKDGDNQWEWVMRIEDETIQYWLPLKLLPEIPPLV